MIVLFLEEFRFVSKRNNTQTSAIRKYFPINFENTEIIRNFVNHKIK